MDIGCKILETFYTLNKGVDLMNPLISIIMPVYNCDAYIEESVRSLCQQTYTNFELIIINDGSEDKTAEKLSSIKDSRIQLVNMKTHKGLTSAFSEGYKLAKGVYILRHDGDDISTPKRLELQCSYLENNPKAAMVSCLISCFTPDPLFRSDCIFIERIQNSCIHFDEIEKAILGGFIPILFPTLMLRKAFIDKVYAENKKLDFDDHTELLLKLIELCPVEKIDNILYHYRRHPTAYHIVNRKDYEQNTSMLLKNSKFKNKLKYREFYSDINSSSKNKLVINEKSPIRVLMLIDALNIGGTETHVLNITKQLIEMGIYVVIATSGGPMEAVFNSYGIKIIKVPFEGDYISNKKKNGMVKFLKNIVDSEKITVIHSHLFASMQLASELYRTYKIPYVVTIHGLFYPNDILFSSCIKASNVIAVSTPVKDMLDKKLGNRIKNKVIVIPNGISSDIIKTSDYNRDVRDELGIPQKGKILCYCSRLDWNKTDAARVFLFSFSQLLAKFPNLHAIIIGDGTGKESIEKEAQIINDMAKGNVVHLVGAKANVIPYYLRSSVVIGTGRVALEAMMCQKPVIAIGNQGYTGIVTEKNKALQWKMYFGDHAAIEKPNVSKLVDDITVLMSDAEMRKVLGEWGRVWCEKKFNINKTTRDIMQTYKNALNV